jgi:hypothetical protein
MLAGVLGLPNMLIGLGTLLPGVHSEVFAVTVNWPVLNEDPTANNIVALPCPLLIVVPAGFDQLYVDAPGTLEIEY